MKRDELEEFKKERDRKELATLAGVGSVVAATSGAFMNKPYLKYPGMVGAFASGLARGHFKRKEEQAFRRGFMNKFESKNMVKAAISPVEIQQALHSLGDIATSPEAIKAVQYAVGFPAVYKGVRLWTKQVAGANLKKMLGKDLNRAERFSLAVSQKLQNLRHGAKAVKNPVLRGPADYLSEYVTVITDPQDIIQGAEKYIRMAHGIAPKETENYIKYIQSTGLSGKAPFLRDLSKYKSALGKAEALVSNNTRGTVSETAKKTYENYLSPGKIEDTVDRLVKTKKTIRDFASKGMAASPTFGVSALGAIAGSQIGYRLGTSVPEYQPDPMLGNLSLVKS